MPLYEYHCDDCGRRFELIRKFSDPPLDKCPHCGGTVRKLFSSPAIQFKGSGFYITDYAKKDQPSGASGGESKGDTSSTDKEKTDSGARSDTADKGDKAGKSEKGEKSDKNAKGDTAGTTEKTTAKTESPASAPKAPVKDGA
jgi:putative FmdB family regulatory protein